MSRTTRSVAIITGATAAVALAGVAAFASGPSGFWQDHMGSQLPAHMTEMDQATWNEMGSMMTGDATVDEMHQWMADQGVSVEQMYRDMDAAGMNPGWMHDDGDTAPR